jgi:hypothetical protein
VRLPKEPAIEFGDKFIGLQVPKGEPKQYGVERYELRKIEMPDGSEMTESLGFIVKVLT